MRPVVFTPAEAGAQIDEALRHAIASLPTEQRLIYTLFYFEELSLEQIAFVMDMPEDRVAALFYWAHANVGAVPLPEESGVAA